MSIHKSKGLEFPVVFVPDVGKEFNFDSTRGDLVMDRHLGVAMRAVDVTRGIKYPTVGDLIVRRRLEQELLAEQMRLLYVAMTRAREKLILCGSVKLDSERRKWLARGGEGQPAEPMGANVMTAGRSFADWLGPALARLGHLDERNAQGEAASQATPFAVTVHRPEEWREWHARPVAREGETERRKIAAMKAVAAPAQAHEAVLPVLDRLRWRYDGLPLSRVRGKLSVTELKRRFDADQEPDEAPHRLVAGAFGRRPAFVQATEEGRPALSAAEVGTAVHAVLSYVDPLLTTDVGSLRWQMGDMVAQGLLSPAEKEAVDVGAIEAFFRTPLGLEIKRRYRHVRREVPFAVALPAGEIEPDLPAELADGEWVHVQGVIDCLIERAAGFAVLDFKTDRIAVDEVSERAEHHRPQLDLYARAVEIVFQRPVIERALYFLHPGVAFVFSEPGQT
jgi:ATP-dependent helicase/nuclease subunit A